MNKLVLICGILLGIPFLSSAQEDTLPRSKIYDTWVLRPDKSSTIKGTLYQVADSSVLVATSLNKYMISRNDLSTGSFNLSEVDYNDIYIVKVRRSNSIPRGSLTFALVGASLGAIIGTMVYEPQTGYGITFSQANYAGIGAVVGSIFSIVGFAIGSIRIEIPINGNIDTFNQNRNKLKKYSYMH